MNYHIAAMKTEPVGDRHISVIIGHESGICNGDAFIAEQHAVTLHNIVANGLWGRVTILPLPEAHPALGASSVIENRHNCRYIICTGIA